MALKICRRKFTEIDANQARRSLSEFLPASTADLDLNHSILGQSRAVNALLLGLELYKPGFNIFVSGHRGTGRVATVSRCLKEMKPACRIASDLCFVHNFEDIERPRLIELPRQQAKPFAEAVKAMLQVLKEDLDHLVNSKQAVERRKSIEETYNQETNKLTEELQQRVAEAGFALARVAEAMTPYPELVWVFEKRGVQIDDIEKLIAAGELTLSPEEVAAIKEKHSSFAGELEQLIDRHQQNHKDMIEAVAGAEHRFAKRAIHAAKKSLLANFDNAVIRSWLNQLEKALLEHIETFRRPTQAEGDDKNDQVGTPDLSAFEVNVFLGQGADQNCPVIHEKNPNYQNIFGSQDRVTMGPGIETSDFSRLRPGALVRAQGGYLILDALDVLQERGVWNHLKRVLKSEELVVMPPEGSNPNATVLNPDPIKLNVKVILVGTPGLYERLSETDPDFAKIFKIKADLDSSIPYADEVLNDYTRSLTRIIRLDGLRDCDQGALDYLIQESMRLASSRDRLSTKFSYIRDILREADFWAAKAGNDLIEGEDLHTAMEGRRNRLNLYEEKVLERSIRDEVIIATTGRVIGQINALSVMSVGEHQFGNVSRITCRVSVGKGGILDIEKETEMSGNTYDKGSLVTQGFLNGRFAREAPLSFAASLCFEQSYHYIDGDSASSTELYLILATLASLPIRQDLAITGSVDQFGRIQPIGGVNEKIEGFFDLCFQRGLTGTQGVIIPESNLSDLMVAPRVQSAIAAGEFHVYPVKSADEGLEILTGRVAGALNSRTNSWPERTINATVQDALIELSKLANKSDS